MIFEYIRFHNYRPYYGTQTIYFTEKNPKFSPFNQNIVLIGGLNGAGKTSLINAIFVCLYGRRFFSKKEYSKILETAINKKFRIEGGTESTIELCFKDSSGVYMIEVKFFQTRTGIEDEITLYTIDVDGQKIKSSTTSEEFISFIDKKIPKEVSQFFIFDAEKIRDLVGQHDAKETIDAIQKVVSLDLYRTLSKDLLHLFNTETKKLDSLVKDDDLTNIQKRLEEIQNILENNDNKIEEIKLNTENLYEQKNNFEKAKRQKFISTSLSKQKISKILGEKKANLKSFQKGIEAFAKTDLLKLILKRPIDDLKSRLQKEKEYQNVLNQNKSAFKSYESFANELMQIQVDPPLTNEQKHQLYESGKGIWKRLNNIRERMITEDLTVIHDLSDGDYRRIISYPNSTTSNLSKLLDDRYKTELEITKYENQLESAPEEVDTTIEDSKIREIDKEIVNQQTNKKFLLRESNKLKDEQGKLTREYTVKLKARNENSDVVHKVELVKNLLSATDEFISEVTILKAKLLKVEIENILNILFRKKDLNRIEFDSKDFTLRIFDEDDREIDLTSRSEGEKQLIALAMIWALTKVAGTKMPFVIDTPLARLDSIHRTNLVNSYFTKLNEQVIILSTDTEIDERFMKDLEPHLVKSYVLEHDDEEEYTKIREGYFEFAGGVL
ncbi:DNA sulfur modification protein DndD [Gottfriedia luciferensis]|uniref:Nuclease SbcCD subunit C n=1 Tax=Gottfriedia luciferensis TaxID=178774 RepID=A0ABX2ZSL9_9BACI|nr:DNA sulfur modification protein DndD [Gottfriedia luciferensis]ODG91512.1 DNA sulfur modification protein DndD [Gottfriedia luciferensis]